MTTATAETTETKPKKPRRKKGETFTPAGPALMPAEEVIEIAKANAEAVAEAPSLTPQDATTDTPADSLDVPAPESPTEAASPVLDDAAKPEQKSELVESRQIEPETVEAAARPIPAEVVAASAPDPEDVAGLRHHLRQIEEMTEEILELEAEHEADKKTAKASKERWEEAQKTLTRFIKKGQEKHPLFDRPKPPAAPASTPSTPAPVASKPAEDDAWKSVELSTLGFTPGVLAKLTEAGIETVGKLAAWSNAGKRLTDIAGIGEAKAEEIENVMAGFWERKAKAQAEAEAQAKAPVEPAAEAHAEPVAPDAPAEPAKPKRKRKPKGEPVEPEATTINEFGQPLDTEEALKEQFERIDAHIAAVQALAVETEAEIIGRT